jgi:hypothetical protein
MRIHWLSVILISVVFSIILLSVPLLGGIMLLTILSSVIRFASF